MAIEPSGLEVAIIGMAGRFPGADGISQLWKNLCEGRESITFFERDELLEAGGDPAEIDAPNYVRARGVVSASDCFDAAFFGYTRREAAILDPQIRLFQECCWHALEDAGYEPAAYPGRIGLYVGASSSIGWLRASPLLSGVDGAAKYEAATLSFKDAISTLTSYRLGLRGPSMTLYTACSTSLLAVHQACRSLLMGDCGMALAGGASIQVPEKSGYAYVEGLTASKDGKTRPFDAEASGTVFSSGVGVVLLKPLADAVADGDHIYGVIRASASNNDGDRKVGYPAPSVTGQTDVVVDALELAGLRGDDITYVETHGTATLVGDPIEVEALRRAFATSRRAFCGLGAVKSNIGHLDAAAGVAGLIKTALALRHRTLPATLHFERPNPKLNLLESPFYINTETRPWDIYNGGVRRAGVSAFGLGGTNVHIILEEAPEPLPRRIPAGPFVLPISARTSGQCAALRADLANTIAERADLEIGDVAFTLQVGRRAFPHRTAEICFDGASALRALDLARTPRVARAQHAVRVELPEAGWQAWVDAAPWSVPEIAAECRELLTEQSDSSGLPWEASLTGGGAARAYLLSALGFVRALRRSGVRVAAVIGSGPGALAAGVEAGSIALHDALANCERSHGIVAPGHAPQETAADLAARQGDRDSGRDAGESLDRVLLGASTSGPDDADAVVVGAPGERLTPLQWLRVLGDLWERGASVRWPNAQDVAWRRVSLPLYPFAREKHWPTSNQPREITKHGELERWFYVPNWRASGSSAVTRGQRQRILVLTANDPLAEGFAARLRARGDDVRVARVGAAYAAQSDGSYRFRAEEAEDASRLLRDLSASGASPDTIISFLAVAANSDRAANIRHALHLPVQLGKALSARHGAHPIACFFVTTRAFPVLPSDDVIPEQQLVMAPALVLPQEQPGTHCKVIDVDVADPDAAMAGIEQEVDRLIAEPLVALRGQQRLVRGFDAVADEVRDDCSVAEGLRGDASYLITGGLGNVGYVLAEGIARQCKAGLILVGKTRLPPPEEWDGYVARDDGDLAVQLRIQRIRALERLGSSVRYLASDLSDADQLRRVLFAAEQEFQPLRGVIHGAGVLRVRSGQVTIDRVSERDFAEQFQPKIEGLLALDEVLTGRSLDFRILVSSLSPILGGLGFVAYAGANAFLDGTAASTRRRPNGGWTTVNWGDWQLHRSERKSGVLGKSIEALELTAEEGWKTFAAVLRLQRKHFAITISSGDLQARHEQWFRREAAPAAAAPATVATPGAVTTLDAMESAIERVWLEFYGTQQVDRAANFFELGAKSLDIVQILGLLVRKLGRVVRLDEMFEHPSIQLLARHLCGGAAEIAPAPVERSVRQAPHLEREIAIVGMAGRFPGARDIQTYWQNLRGGVDCITRFTRDELLAAQVPAADLDRGNYVAAKGYLPGSDEFDATFFGYSHRDAAQMDPQIRLFHECVWEAFEHAGYDVKSCRMSVGVFCGASPNLLWQVHTLLREYEQPSGLFEATLLNDKDSLSTQISYKLDLKGPSVNIFTGCSTSLVAIDAACTALESGRCDMAVAGGVTVSLPAKAGYVYEEGMLFSPSGRCRAFDDGADGMLFGDGAGVVVLKRAEDARRDGDTIYALIRGSAVANDGSRKVGYTAPGVDGQARAIRAALEQAGCKGDDVTYIETHGTGTKLGDMVEIAALRQAFASERTGFCRIGSVKTNIGHLNAASGVAGLIKTVLSLRHRELVPSLNFEEPNRSIDFASSPFRVNTSLLAWEAPFPRRAGVSSFGIGGTNAHLILEEAEQPAVDAGHGVHLLPVSARSERALTAALDNLQRHLERRSDQALGDVAYTLQVGRHAHEQRAVIVADSVEAARIALGAEGARPRATKALRNPRSMFLFPGQGSQYVRMGLGLFETETVFRAELLRCFDIVKQRAGLDLEKVLYPAGADAVGELGSTAVAQPLLFAFEFSLARLLMHYGLEPAAMLGYSFGEYVAASLAGVMSLSDALGLVVLRGQLMSQTEGAMLGVPKSEAEVLALCDSFASAHDVEAPALAIDNGESCVVSGSKEVLDLFQDHLRNLRIIGFPVAVSHAAHTSKLDGAVSAFEAALRGVALSPPRVPYVSNVTGTWVTAEQATDPKYWIAQMSGTVRFAAALRTLASGDEAVLIEVGPGMDLSNLARRFVNSSEPRVFNLIRPEASEHDDVYYLRHRLGRLWALGLPLEWAALHQGEARRRVELPTYPFERQRFELTPVQLDPRALAKPRDVPLEKAASLEDWFYVPAWTSRPASPAQNQAAGRWVVFATERVDAEFLASLPGSVVTVYAGTQFAQVDDDTFTICPARVEDFDELLRRLGEGAPDVDHIIYAWSLIDAPADVLDAAHAAAARQWTYESLVWLAKALIAQRWTTAPRVTVLTAGAEEVVGGDARNPSAALARGAAQVLGQESPEFSVATIDVELPLSVNGADLVFDLASSGHDDALAYRNGRRWVRDHSPVKLGHASGVFRDGGVYLVTGGLGGIGYALSRHLLQRHGVKLIIIGRSDVLTEHGASPALAERSRRLAALREIGTVRYYSLDVGDGDALGMAVRDAETALGSVDGVVHAAGLLTDEAFVLLREAEPGHAKPHYRAKIDGTLSLARVFRGRKLDFCLLMSSVSSVLGGLGFAPYAAANRFLDALVASPGLHNWVSVAWSDWRYWDESEKKTEIGAIIRELSMAPEEGIECVQRALGQLQRRHYVHSPGSLAVRKEQWRGGRLAAGSATPDAGTSAAGARPELTTAYVAPSSTLQASVCTVWQELFRIDRVGIEDDFFELGGDSLKAVTCASILARRTGLDVSVRDFFELRTVAALVSSKGRGRRRPLATIQAAPGAAHWPLSSAQARIFVASQLADEATIYNDPSVLIIDGALDVARVERCMRSLVERHEAFRTAIRIIEAEPRQVVLQSAELEFGVQNCDERSLDERVSSLVRPFDLSRPPHLRVNVLRLGEARHALVVDMHHIVTDGVSYDVFVSDFIKLYQGVELSAPECTYKDYAVWQQSARATDALASQREYWRGVFASGPSPARVGGGMGARQVRVDTVTFDADLRAGVQRVCQENDITLYMFFLAAVTLLIHKYTSEADVTIGSPVAGRSQPELAGVIGVFVNMLPLRSEVKPAEPLREFLRRLRQNTLDALDNQDWPFDAMVRDCDLQGTESPLFDVMYLIQEQDTEHMSFAGLSARAWPLRRRQTHYDMAFAVTDAGNAIRISMEVDYGRLRVSVDADTVGKHVRQIVGALVGNLDRDVEDIEVHAPARRSIEVDGFAFLTE